MTPAGMALGRLVLVAGVSGVGRAGGPSGECRGLVEGAEGFRCVEAGRGQGGLRVLHGETVHRFYDCKYERYRKYKTKGMVLEVNRCSDQFGNGIVSMYWSTDPLDASPYGKAVSAYGCLSGPVVDAGGDMEWVAGLPGMRPFVESTPPPEELRMRVWDQVVSVGCND